MSDRTLLEKPCSTCRVVKPLEEFHSDPTNKKWGRAARCRPCANAAARAWRQVNLERAKANSAASGKAWREAHPDEAREYARAWRSSRPEYSREARLRRRGLSIARYEEILKSQGGRCLICRSDDPGSKHGVWAVDHDHSCCNSSIRACERCFRGLLCHPCNAGLGFMKDDPERLRAAADYLESHRGNVRNGII